MVSIIIDSREGKLKELIDDDFVCEFKSSV